MSRSSAEGIVSWCLSLAAGLLCTLSIAVLEVVTEYIELVGEADGQAAYRSDAATAAQIEDAVVKLCERDYHRRTDRAR